MLQSFRLLKPLLKIPLAAQAFYNADEFLALHWETTYLADVAYLVVGVGVRLD